MATSGYEVVQFPGFGSGMNLRDKADVVAMDQAVDAMDVEFTDRGAVKERPGYDEFTAVVLTNQPDSIATYEKADTSYVVVGNGSRLTQLSAAGAVVGTEYTSTTASPHFFARYGAPGSEQLYAANGTDQIVMLDGTSAWATPDYEDETNTDVAPKAKFLAVTQNSNRLVSADHRNSTGFSAGATKDTVRFSDAGDPLTWAQDNYVLLTPGDGEEIKNIISWRELLFVFKETKFFVFYGEGQDNAGEPVFNYRAVSSGVGLASSRALCAGPDGVYFLDRHGVYRTTGQDPVLVSDLIDPIFFGGTSTFYQGGELLHSQITNSAMTWHDERVYLAFTTTSTTNNRTLVFDTRYGWWTLWSFAASCLTSFDVAGHKLLFGYAAGDNHIAQHDTSYTSDAGVAISSRWQSGWADLGTPNEKVVRQTRVTGGGGVASGGLVTVGVLDDFATDPSQTSTLDFSVEQPKYGTAVYGGDPYGPLASYGTKLHRKAVKGKVFSIRFSSNTLDNPWVVYRADYELRGQRAPALSTEA